jgi:amino acid adenylation domain-containing protein
MCPNGILPGGTVAICDCNGKSLFTHLPPSYLKRGYDTGLRGNPHSRFGVGGHAPHPAIGGIVYAAEFRSLPAVIFELARRTPDAIAVRAPGRVLSYAALTSGAARVSRRLRDLCLGAEMPAAILCERSPERIIAALAAWQAGSAYAPLDPAWPASRIATILDDLGPSVLIGRSGAAGFASATCRFLDIDTALAEAPDELDAARDIDPAALAYIIYTSGSTGRPKGVEITHGNLSHLIGWHCAAFGVTTADRASHLAGLGFDASVWEVWPHLCAGATLVLAPEEVAGAPGLLQSWLVDERISIAFVPTVLAEPLIRRDWPEATALRVLLTGGEALQVRPRPGLPFRVINNYGPSECTVLATSGEVRPDGEGLPDIGRPIAGTMITLRDDTGALVADGETGEICIAGPGVGRGYRNLPKLTAERFAEGRFRTGDLGCRLPGGEIAFRGRADDQIKIRGHRIEPQEIVAVLNRHPMVAASAVALRAEPGAAPRLIAYVLPADKELPGATELRELLALHLPQPMIPSAFVRMTAWPLTPSGKLDRDALPAPDADNLLPHARYRAPATPAEQLLAEIVQDLLGVENVGADDSFFLLGGHSLLGTQLVMRARELFGVPLSLRHLFEAQTVARLALIVEQLLIEQLAAETEPPEPQVAG